MKSNQEDVTLKKIIANSQDQTLSLYEKDCLVKVFSGVSFGKNGVKKDKKEGDGCTPKGVFPLGFAFGMKRLDIEYPYYLVNEHIYWVSDVNSKYYNEWVELTSEKKKFDYSYMKTSPVIAWEEAEHLTDYTKQYELAIVIAYNLEKEKGSGSAIFLHVQDKEYTSGCVATTKENLEFILHWLGKEQGVIEIK